MSFQDAIMDMSFMAEPDNDIPLQEVPVYSHERASHRSTAGSVQHHTRRAHGNDKGGAEQGICLKLCVAHALCACMCVQAALRHAFSISLDSVDPNHDSLVDVRRTHAAASPWRTRCLFSAIHHRLLLTSPSYSKQSSSRTTKQGAACGHNG